MDDLKYRVEWPDGYVEYTTDRPDNDNWPYVTTGHVFIANDGARIWSGDDGREELM